MGKNKRKEKSIVVSQNLIHLVVPPTFLSGSTPLHIHTCRKFDTASSAVHIPCIVTQDVKTRSNEHSAHSANQPETPNLPRSGKMRVYEYNIKQDTHIVPPPFSAQNITHVKHSVFNTTE